VQSAPARVQQAPDQQAALDVVVDCSWQSESYWHAAPGKP
jgi:hypothetical protein